MNLQAADIEYNENDGIYVDKFLTTTNPSVFSIGDCLARAMSKSEAELFPGTGP